MTKDWGCAPDEPATGPSAAPVEGTASAVTYVVRDLGTLGGEGFDSGDEPRDETAWYVENGIGGVLPTLVPGPELDNHAGAEAVNRAGTIVGFSKAPNGSYHAVLWRRQ